MPEGPEVAVLANYLNEKIAGEKLKEVNIKSGKYTKKTSKSTRIDNYDDFKKSLPTKIKSIKCCGKFIYWEFENNWYCFMTLGLSGRVLLENDFNKYTNIEKSEPTINSSHRRIIFVTDNKKIYYLDMRNFGTIDFCKDHNTLNDKLNKKLGIDLLNNYNLKSNYDEILKKLKKIRNKNGCIADVLLNQKIFTGVGNYIRADALYLSKMSPFMTIDELLQNDENIKMLIKNIHKIMKKSYNAQMKYLKKNYYNYSNLNKNYSFLVYKQKKTKKGEEVIHKKMKNNRMIWYVDFSLTN